MKDVILPFKDDFLSFIAWRSLTWYQAPQLGKKAKNRVNKKKYRQKKRAERWSGEGERAAPPFSFFAHRFFLLFPHCGAGSQAKLASIYKINSAEVTLPLKIDIEK